MSDNRIQVPGIFTIITGRVRLLVFFLLLPATLLQGQQVLFKNYSVRSGMSSNTVWNILQDDQGYMWFGTKNGLNRFDGYNFKIYQVREDKDHADNSLIHSVCKINSTTFWVGTEEGLYSFDLSREKFERIAFAKKDLIFDILKSSGGEIWVATRSNGVYRFDPRRGTVMNYRAAKGGLSLNQVRKLAEDNNRHIWMGTFGEGIDVLDPVTNRFRHHKADGGTGTLSSNFILSLYKDPEGTLWAGTLSGGLNKWTAKAQRFEVFRTGGEGSISDNIVRAIYQPMPGQVYVATEKGLNVLNTATGIFTTYKNNRGDPYTISDNAVYSICEDRQGGIWVGTYFGGVNYFSPGDASFELYYPNGSTYGLSGSAVSCFLEDKPGRFWVGTENGGLNYFDTASGRFFRYPFAPYTQPLSYTNIHALYKDRGNRLWVGTFSGGLNVVDLNNGQVNRYYHDPAEPGSISSNSIYSIYEDRSGTIWVGTVKGLNTFDPVTRQFIKVTDLDLQNSCIYKVYEDSDRCLWIATYENGLIKKDLKTGKWEQFRTSSGSETISSNKIISLCDNEGGVLWVGTDGGGLNRLHKQTGTFTRYGPAQGMSNVVFGIVPDDSGYLWLSTNNGLLRFSEKDNRIWSYTGLNNLQGKLYNYNAYYRSSNGRIFLGGINGFNTFYPGKIRTETTGNNLILTSFKIFDHEPDLSDRKSALQQLVGFTRNIQLSYSQSVISFEYALLDFKDPNKIKYAYKMEGFDKQWNNVGTQRVATYTNLPPGEYLFKVKATDIYGNWNDKEASVVIRVRPPFYRTNLAYVLYMALLVAGIFLLRNYYKQRELRKNEVRLEKMKVQREKEFYQQKIDFFTTMAHEIRTPLSLIMAPLENLKDAELQSEQRKQLHVMEENSERLQSLVNQLLDFRRIESDIYTIRKEPVELISFVQALYARFGTIAAQKKLKFLLTTDIDRLTIDADPEALQKILTNLLMNAFKFAAAAVELKVTQQEPDARGNRSVALHIKDDGIGIPETELTAVFKPFYKVSGDGAQLKNIGGTGIGLSLAKALAEKHDGSLTAVNGKDGFTTFILTLPFETGINGEGPVAAAETGSAEEETGRPAVLIVEDDLNMLDYISANLKGEGYHTCCAINGKEALGILQSRQIDLVLSDLMMPEMDGIVLCRRIKEQISSSHIPVVLLTAKGTTEAELQALESGADAYIMKPFKWKQITVTIKNLLETRARLKEKFSAHPFVEADTLYNNTNDKIFVEKITTIIEERLDDYQLSVEELSKAVAMSRSTLHKKLKAISGHSPNEFIRVIRLKEAAKLLLSGNCNVSEAGYRTGFNSPSYFTKCFTLQFGATPSEFVEKYLSDHANKDSIFRKDQA
ncbi:hybrid sensor histidine kinase/response regulator transcription factor [Niabella beijingensis]|uniref:hybrid sensor histidine kinase/response regulator transcription factor n=1 Tax=Niabella beijingensis TaxID=2872700 RepID=UPI001CBC3F34|nr:two-component regulator propeller domain-containing protein [Niabella beijingensis]MBZ4188017.1 response regulator [Niabella beijingensis]